MANQTAYFMAIPKIWSAIIYPAAVVISYSLSSARHV